MRSFGRSGYSLIGIDLAATGLRAAQLRVESHGVRLWTHVVIDRPDPSVPIGRGDVARLASVLKKREFHGDRVVLGAPQGALRREILTLPPISSGAPVEALARAELNQSVAGSDSAFEFAMWELPPRSRSGDGVDMMVAICPHADALEQLDLLQHEGLEVAAIDVPCWALARACGPLIGQSETTVILDPAWNGHSLCVVQDRAVVYERALSEGAYSGLVSAVSNRLGVELPLAWRAVRQAQAAPENCDPGVLSAVEPILQSAREALVDEVRTSLSFVRHRYGSERLERVLVAGEPSGLAKALSGTLGIEARALEANDLIDSSQGVSSGVLTRAIGYARWEGEE